MTPSELIDQVRNNADSIEFSDVMSVITEHYEYTPSRFTNGEVVNEAGSNEGSCKIFAFGQMNNLSEVETLALFGSYYRDDVMGNPAGDDHANIRNFILDGWLGINFDNGALKLKE
jgi:hypothetical protein